MNPNNAFAYHGLADHVAVMGDLDESVRLVRRSRQCDPFSRLVTAPVIGHLFLARRYEECIAEARKLLETDPEFWTPYAFIFRALWQLGRYEEAIAALRERGAAWADSQAAVMERELRQSGPRAAYLAVAEAEEERAKTSYVRPSNLVGYYAMAGEPDRAFAWLERVLEERDPFLAHLIMDPRVDSLRPDPRYQDMLRRIGLDP